MAILGSSVINGDLIVTGTLSGTFNGQAAHAEQAAIAITSLACSGRAAAATTADSATTASSATTAGSADQAKKLVNASGTAYSAGSAARPVYFTGGVPTAGTYTFNQSLQTTNDVTFNKVTSTTSFVANSDKRLKENINEWAPKKSILDLPIKEFDYKIDKSHHIGCLAQDLQEICPEIVCEDSNGYLSIEESKIAYLLIVEVKKLKTELATLKQELKEREIK